MPIAILPCLGVVVGVSIYEVEVEVLSKGKRPHKEDDDVDLGNAALP
jgi:hypothetical protein